MNIPLLTDLLELWRDTTLNNTALFTYCNTTFGKDPKIYIGIDPKNPPQIEDAPFIAIHPVGANQGIMSDSFAYSIEIHIGVDDGLYNDYNANGSTAEMRGLYRTDAVYELVKDALDETASSKYLAPDMVSLDIDTEALPLVQAHVTLEARMANTMGVNVTL